MGNASQISLPKALLLLCMQSAGAQTRGNVAEALRSCKKTHLAFFFPKCLSFWTRKSRQKQVFSFLILFFILAVCVLLQDLPHRALHAVSTGLFNIWVLWQFFPGLCALLSVFLHTATCYQMSLYALECFCGRIPLMCSL